MNSPVAATAPRARRAVFALQAAVVAFAVTTCCVLAVVLGDRFPLRVDATASGEHRLSDHTRAVLGELHDPIRLVVAVRQSDLPRRTQQRLQDVLGAFEHGSDKVRVQLIDVGGSQGLADFGALLRDIRQQDARALDDYSAAVRDAAAAGERVAEGLESAAGALPGVIDALVVAPPPGLTAERVRSLFDAHGGQLRARAGVLRDGLREGLAMLDAAPAADAPLPVPKADLAASRVAVSIGGASQALTALSLDLDRCAGPASGASALAKDRAGALNAQVNTLRDQSARESARLERLPRLRIFSVASAIQNAQGALLIGPQRGGGEGSAPAPGAPPSVAAINLGDLLAIEADTVQGAPPIDLRFRAEELITAGLAAFTTTPKPLVVLVHAGAVRLEPTYAGFRQFVDRLALRGMAVAEWPAALDSAEPKAVTDARAAKNPRPVVFVTISPDVRDAEGAARMGRLASRLEALAEAGEAMLVSVNRSTLPGVSATDPLVQWLEAFGVRADSGRVLIEETAGAGQPSAIAWLQVLTDPGAGHRLSEAIRGLPTVLLQPIALDITPTAGESATGMATASTPGVRPLITLPALASRWAESEWQQYRGGASRPGLPPPRNDSARDRAQGSLPGGAWMLAAACERRDPTGRTPLQRLVVIGSNGWFADPVVSPERVEGAAVSSRFPGNLEFAEAAIWWLAQREDRIARSAAAQSIPLIPPLSAGQLSALQWGLVAVLPLLVLLLGAGWLLLRR